MLGIVPKQVRHIRNLVVRNIIILLVSIQNALVTRITVVGTLIELCEKAVVMQYIRNNLQKTFEAYVAISYSH